MIVILVLIILLILLIALPIGVYNRLVALKNQVGNAWSQIDVLLKRRADMIPNLVETVKGYASHEQETFTRVTQARAQVMQGGSVADQAQAENVLTNALKSLFAVTEAYPELKANQNFLSLQEELTGTENKIGFARQFYNDIVMQYNNAIQQFPGNVFAGMFGYTAKEFFETHEADREVPKVKF